MLVRIEAPRPRLVRVDGDLAGGLQAAPAAPALILGGAACVNDDVEAVRAMGPLRTDEWVSIAVNAAGALFRRVDHWVTLHPEHFHDDDHAWLATRQSMGWRTEPVTWGGVWRTGRDDARPWSGRPALTDRALPVQPGSDSGLHAVQVARHLGARPITLCGVPMDAEMGHVAPGPDGDRPWREALGHREAWTAAYDRGELADVRSMSGWTRELLGAPDVG